MHKLIEYQIENVMKFDLLVFGNIKKCCASYSPGYLFYKILWPIFLFFFPAFEESIHLL